MKIVLGGYEMFELIYERKMGFRAPNVDSLLISKDKRIVAHMDDFDPEDKVYLYLMDEENNERNVRLSIIRAGRNTPNHDGEERCQNLYLSQDDIRFGVSPYETYDSTLDKWGVECVMKQGFKCENGKWVRKQLENHGYTLM